jgi:hypothetical protein
VRSFRPFRDQLKKRKEDGKEKKDKEEGGAKGRRGVSFSLLSLPNRSDSETMTSQDLCHTSSVEVPNDHLTILKPNGNQCTSTIESKTCSLSTIEPFECMFDDFRKIRSKGIKSLWGTKNTNSSEKDKRDYKAINLLSLEEEEKRGEEFMNLQLKIH